MLGIVLWSLCWKQHTELNGYSYFRNRFNAHLQSYRMQYMRNYRTHQQCRGKCHLWCGGTSVCPRTPKIRQYRTGALSTGTSGSVLRFFISKKIVESMLANAQRENSWAKTWAPAGMRKNVPRSRFRDEMFYCLVSFQLPCCNGVLSNVRTKLVPVIWLDWYVQSTSAMFHQMLGCIPQRAQSWQWRSAPSTARRNIDSLSERPFSALAIDILNFSKKCWLQDFVLHAIEEYRHPQLFCCAGLCLVPTAGMGLWFS